MSKNYIAIQETEMINYEIKSRLSGEVLWSGEADNIKAALTTAIKAGADLCGANLHNADLSGADLSEVDLREADLYGAYLHDADLRGTCLRDANLRGADLSGAYLCDANLRGVNLSGAYLHDADLRNVDLCGANLRNANLRGADLSDAYLRGADLRGTCLRNATYTNGAPITKELLQISGLHYPVLIIDDHIQIGCEFHSIEDWRKFDDARILEMDGSSALKFWKAHKDQIMGLCDATGRPIQQPEVEDG